jgi:hypothetical protein
MSLWQFRWSSEGRGTFFPSERERRRAVRALARVGGPGLLIFSLVDDHIHVVVEVEKSVRLRARGICLALFSEPAFPVGEFWMRPVDGRSHLFNTVRYYLRQTGHHRIAVHPALWTGSCFPDLVGARRLPGFSKRLGEYLPRMSRMELLEAAGLGGVDLKPADDGVIRHIGACRLAEATSASLALDPKLEGREADVVLARAAVCRLANGAGLARSEVVHALGIPLRSAQRLAHFPVPEDVLAAVRLRSSLEELGACGAFPPLSPSIDFSRVNAPVG